MRITRLGEGVDETGRLSAAAMERTWSALSDYRTMCDIAGVTRGLLVATSAVRDAENGAEFLDGAAQRSGVEARILSGRDEARFSFNGATSDLTTSDRPFLVVDIGGGSTELATVVEGSLECYSMQLGCVRVAERVLGRNEVDDDARRIAEEMIREQLDAAFLAVPAFTSCVGQVQLIGLAGTMATLAQLDQGLGQYRREKIHHYVISRESVTKWRRRLEGLSAAQRLEIPGMVPGREDVMHAGLFILEATMDRYAASDVMVSENDILDGIVADLAAK
jgi:exopolyphosphatase / guanosine-5'-triphosphate,3'-diphosphate pyrophosphatase